MRHEEEGFAGSSSTSRPFTKTKTRKRGRNVVCWRVLRIQRHRYPPRKPFGKIDRRCDDKTTIVANSIDHGVDQHNYDYHPDPNDPESTAGLVRNTAFRAESREYHHAKPVAAPRTMENLRSSEMSLEKRPGKCFLQDRYGRGESFECPGWIPGDAFSDIRSASFDRSSLRHVLDDNTAFNDDDDYEENYGNDDDDCNNHRVESDGDCRNNCNVNDSRQSPKDNVGINESRERAVRLSYYSDNTKKRRRSWNINNCKRRWDTGTRGEDWPYARDGRFAETDACLDVPGGRLFAIVCRDRCFSIGGKAASNVVGQRSLFSAKKSESPLVNDFTTGNDCQTSGDSDDREKWKKPRRRRRRKSTDDRERRVSEIGIVDDADAKYDDNDDDDDDDDGEDDNDDNDDDDDDDDDNHIDVSLDNEIEDKRCNGFENDFTAWSGEPIVGFERSQSRKRRRRRRRKRRRGQRGSGRGEKGSRPFRENIVGAKVAVSGKVCDWINREASLPRIREFVGKGRGSRRECGAKSYGLLFALYFLALPILCSTDPSSPAASAFAQRSPLIQSDNLMTRNSSSHHQPHQTRRDDGAAGREKSHPYNEYTWEVNQINPWLSACDLAGPAPADLQGSCGPPEVPKNCPLKCPSSSQAGTNGAFNEVIKMLGVNERAKSGAAGSRWKLAGKSVNKSNKNNEDGRNKGTEEAAMAPEQCLFYLEASHKRDICRDNFGRGSSLSFSNTRENRYWYMSGLRLRHCCEHAAVNALAPGKGGPLEDVLNGGRKCSEALDKLLLVDALAARLHCEFEEVLARYDCGQSYSVIHNCTHCKEAYRKWVCSSLVPYFAHGGPPALETSTNTWSSSRLRPCRSFCQSVEQRCPYLLPGDRAPAYPTQYAGEPTFLCRDPNIPETGEQALRALHGNEKEECCFRVCDENEPGSGVCANCTDQALSNRAGHDIPTAPQCEITTMSPIPSGSTDEKSADSRIVGADESSAAASPATATTTSASFCGGGGVGSVPSSSGGQSTAQQPPPSSISLICLFWVSAALISLCTGQTIFPWSPPFSALIAGDYSTSGSAERQRRGSVSGATRKRWTNKEQNGHEGVGRIISASKSATLSVVSRSSTSSPATRRILIVGARNIVPLALFAYTANMTADFDRRDFVDLIDTLLRRFTQCRYYFYHKFSPIIPRYSSIQPRPTNGHVVLARRIPARRDYYFRQGNDDDDDDEDYDDDYYNDASCNAAPNCLFDIRHCDFPKKVPLPPCRKRRKRRRRRSKRRRRGRSFVVSISSAIIHLKVDNIIRQLAAVFTDVPAGNEKLMRSAIDHRYYYYYYHHYYYYSKHCYLYYCYYYYYYRGENTWWWWCWWWWWWWWSSSSSSSSS